jgi:hypothetical protein
LWIQVKEADMAPDTIERGEESTQKTYTASCGREERNEIEGGGGREDQNLRVSDTIIFRDLEINRASPELRARIFIQTIGISIDRGLVPGVVDQMKGCRGGGTKRE